MLFHGPVLSTVVPLILTISPAINHVPFSGFSISTPRDVSLVGGTIIAPPPLLRGVQLRSNTVSTAQDASSKPKPHSSFHLSDTSELGLPFSSLEFLKISLISVGFRLESACNINATTPETIGVAIEVPSLDSYELSAVGLGVPGNEVPVAACAE